MITQNKFIWLFALLLLFSTLSLAASSSGSAPAPFTGVLQVVKTAPSSVAYGEEFIVNISITNTGSAATQVVVVEYLANVNLVSGPPVVVSNDSGAVMGVLPPHISWNFTISPGQVHTVSYSVKPKTVGTISIGPTQAYVPGAVFRSNAVSVEVACTASTACDPTIGESSRVCPGKCNLDLNQTPPAVPQQKLIPTPEFKPIQKQQNESVMVTYLPYIAVLAIIIVGTIVYFLLFRKK